MPHAVEKGTTESVFVAVLRSTLLLLTYGHFHNFGLSGIPFGIAVMVVLVAEKRISRIKGF